MDTTQDIEGRLKALEASEKRLRLITANVPAMICYIDAEERYQFVNPTVELWYGVSRRAYPGKTVREMRGEKAYAEIKDFIRRALNGQTVSYQRITHEASMPRHVDVKYIPDMGSDGKVAGFYVMIMDISRIKQAERTLRESEARFRAMSDASPLGLFVTDAAGKVTYVNERFSAITGTVTQVALDRGWTVGLHPEDAAAIAEGWRHAIAGQAHYEHDCRFTRPDGSIVWAQIKANPFFDGSTTLGYVGTVEDITKRKEVEHRLSQMAQYDSLTGLPNRSLFHDRLAQARNRRSRNGRLFALMYLDVDHFKSVNDTLGHAAGDALLKSFAVRLQNTLRSVDTVARLGGDEFVVLIEDLHESENASMVARKIVDAMQEPFEILGKSLKVTTSVGVAWSHDAETSGEDLLDQADKALYLAKRAGRNCFHVSAQVLTDTIRMPVVEVD